MVLLSCFVLDESLKLLTNSKKSHCQVSQNYWFSIVDRDLQFVIEIELNSVVDCHDSPMQCLLEG